MKTEKLVKSERKCVMIKMKINYQKKKELKNIKKMLKNKRNKTMNK